MEFSNAERNIILVYASIAIVYLKISTITVVYATTTINSKIPGVQQVLNKLKNAQPMMIHMLHFGTLLIYIYSYVTATTSSSVSICIIRLFLLHSGFFLIVGSLLLKLYRIYIILNSGFKRVKMSDDYLMRMMLITMLFVWAYLIIVAVKGGFSINDYCYYKYYQIEYSLVALEGLMFVAIIVLSHYVRKAPPSLTDASRIVQSISASIIMILILFPIVSSSSSLKPFAICIGLLLASTFTMIETTGHCIYQIAVLYLEAERKKGNVVRASLTLENTGIKAGDHIDDIAFLFDMSSSVTAIGNVHKIRDLDFFQHETLREITSTQEREPDHPIYLSKVVMQETHNKELVILFDALQRAFKIIARGVRRSGTKKSENKDMTGQTSASGRKIRSLDVLANQALARALINSKVCCALISSESERPFVVPQKYAGNFVVSYYPINGASNLECNIAVGCIIGVWHKINEKVSLIDCLRMGRDLVASAYCMFSFSTELILTFGNGNRRFRHDTSYGEFTLCDVDFSMPQEPQCIYSINEGNTDGTDAAIKSAVKRFKHAKPNPYTLRYTGSLVADFHRTLAYGGIYLYPHDVAKPEGKLRVLYECGPLGFIIEQAGGFAMTSNYDGKGTQNILDIEVTTIHQRCPLIFGCKRDIDIIIEEYKNVAAKLGTALAKPITSPQGPRKFSTERVYTTFSETLTSSDITKPRRESSNSLDDKIEYIV